MESLSQGKSGGQGSTYVLGPSGRDINQSEMNFRTTILDRKLMKLPLQNEAIAIQPFDAQNRRDAYISSIKYPFILGATVAGTIIEIGPDVRHLKVGDRVVSDTPVYKKRETRYGGWQKYVVGKAGLSAKASCFEHKTQSFRN
jgi:hypothetical protein